MAERKKAELIRQEEEKRAAAIREAAAKKAEAQKRLDEERELAQLQKEAQQLEAQRRLEGGERLKAEQQRKREEAERRKAAAEAAAARRAEELQLEKQRQIDIARSKEEERKREIVRQQQEAERKKAEAKRIADEKRAAELAEAQRKKEEAQKFMEQRHELARLEAEYQKLKAAADRLKEANSTAAPVTEKLRNTLGPSGHSLEDAKVTSQTAAKPMTPQGTQARKGAEESFSPSKGPPKAAPATKSEVAATPSSNNQKLQEALKAAPDKMKADAAQFIREIDQKDKIIAQQKTISDLTYKAQVISVYREEIGIAGIKATFVLAPIVGEYAGAVARGKNITLTYIAGKEAVKTLLENGLDKLLEAKHFVQSDANENVVVRLASPAIGYAGGKFGYPLQIIIRRADLIFSEHHK